VNALTPAQVKQLHALPVDELIKYWDAAEALGRKQGKLEQVVRTLCLADLYYLLVRVCGRKDLLPCVDRPGFVDNQFAFERCREVQAEPDGYLDLWSREHWKSSILTFGKTIQDILEDPNVTIGIFSHTRPIAKAFLRQIMRELETNKALHAAFPDVLWGEDVRAAQKWSEDDGIIVKRSANPNEATVEAWGLVDGQPTSKHFKKLKYDDVVVAGSVTTPEMIAKTMLEMERSYNLGTTPGSKCMAGTRWHYNDAHRTVIERGTFIAREYPGRKGGTEEGESIVWDEETHLKKRKEQGPYTYAAQILLNPKADSLQGFRREWLCHYRKTPGVARMNGYILVDAASSKKRGSDYTAMMVVGLNVDKKRYVLDMVRDRLNLKERSDRLFSLHRKWLGQGLKIQHVRYERYGLMADVQHLEERMEHENYRFKIVEVAGVTSKQDRIKRLIPLFEQAQIWLPETLHITSWEKVPVDLVRAFIEEEYMAFPVGLHEDMLDALARMEEPDLKLVWPMEDEKPAEEKPVQMFHEVATAWMA
jgi:predicted phage terminase large subunit-like protein